MTEYRWNQAELAQGYDAGAPLVHPHYVEVQDAILAALPFDAIPEGTVVDLGGGSGRLLERILDRWSSVRGVNVDQSAPFLDLALARLNRFGDRVTFIHERLQGNWAAALSGSVNAFISMSAIHHLDATEKQRLAQQVHDALQPGGLFLNGDEVRPASDDEYLALLRKWAAHMESLIETQQVTPAMADALMGWKQRNVDQFDRPKQSGDDCHETAEEQLASSMQAGLVDTTVRWQRDLWTLLSGRRPE